MRHSKKTNKASRLWQFLPFTKLYFAETSKTAGLTELFFRTHIKDGFPWQFSHTYQTGGDKMITRIKNILYIAIAVLSGLAAIYLLIGREYIIKGFALVYILCGIVIACALLAITLVMEKLRRKKIRLIIITVLLVIVTLFSCEMLLGAKRMLFGNEKFYSTEIDGIEDKEIVLYEYDAFRGYQGCLCIKINDFIYREIPDTWYNTEDSLLNPDMLTWDYDHDTKLLTMKYKSHENIEQYYEITAVIP